MGDYKKKFLVIKNLLNQIHFLRSIHIFSNNIGHTIYANISKNINKVQWVEISPNQEPALELHSRFAPSVEAHHRVNSHATGRNSEGRRIIIIIKWHNSGKLVAKYCKRG